MKIRYLFLPAVVVVFLLGSPGAAFAQSTAFTYHGHLSEQGRPANGDYDLTFSVFDGTNFCHQVGNTLTNTHVSITNGLFATLLDFGPDIFTGPERWLELSVRTNGAENFSTLSPRQLLTPTPYAIKAASASHFSGVLSASQVSGLLSEGQIPPNIARLNGDATFTGSLNFTNPGNRFAGNGAGLTGVDAQTLGGFNAGSFWRLPGNSGTTAGLNFLGTTDDQPLEFKVNNLRALRLEPNTNGAPNLIGGAPINFVRAGTSGATISGGGTVSGLESNSIFSDFATIGGGSGNTIPTNTQFATIGGGRFNEFKIPVYGFGWPTGFGTSSTISGGTSNQIWTAHSVIAGGTENQIGTASAYFGETGHAIGGGLRNVISYQISGSTIGGGTDNTLASSYATIAGGTGNSIAWNGPTSGNSIGGGVGNRIRAQASNISGGTGNSVAGFGYAAVGGGLSNRVSGVFSVIPGGFNNTANGHFSLAAGSRAQAEHSGAFVWADSNDFDFTSSNANEFSARCVGGARFVSGIDPAGIPNAGVELVPGEGSWSSLSDRNAKENFSAINPRTVLEQVSQLPITTWNYKSQKVAIRHIGPMAQDFAAAFQVGANDRRITTVDADGVALAAIQGLDEIVKEKEARIQSLESRLAKAEDLLQQLVRKQTGKTR